jgi:MtrB/PioB family decaheme-associated outer membrane protein
MNTLKHTLRPTLMALAILGAFSQAAVADDLAQYLKPSSTVSLGGAALTGDPKDRAVTDQYTGMRQGNAQPLFDLDYVMRDDGTGTWTIVNIKNLAQSTREASVLREKQGDWKLSASFSGLERDYPRTVNTGLGNVGTVSPSVSRLLAPGTGNEVNLKTTRSATSVGIEKWFNPSLQLEVNFKNDDKSGARLWGRGYDCAAYVCGTSTTTAINQAAFVKNAIMFMPEPISSSTQQLEARLNFHTDKLLLSTGYYGTHYGDNLTSMKAAVPNVFNTGLGTPLPGYPAVTSAIIPGGGTSLQDVLQLPTALPPDNQAHQFYIDGNYALAPKTKVNFKYAYTYATQHDNFLANGLTDAPAGFADLNGKVVTTLVQLGITSRPVDKLSLTANARHEKKDDQTPQALYSVEPVAVLPATTPAKSTTVGAYWNNALTSSTRTAGKLEASYRMPGEVRATLGADYSSIEREVPTDITEDKVAGLTALREKNTEKTYRFELRRSLGESFNGGISYSKAKRDGSDWTSLSQLSPATVGISATNLQLVNLYCGGKLCYGQQIPATSILGMSATAAFPLSMTDLERKKWKFSGDWNPTESFSVQLVIENGKDTNTEPVNPVAGGKGWRDSKIALRSLDASYALSDAWKLSAYASHTDQTQHINHSTGYLADLNDVDNAAGLTVTGKISETLGTGGTLSYLKDANHYNIAAATGTSGALPGVLTQVPASAANLAQAAVGLPDATFRQLGLKLWLNYALQKSSDLRFTVMHTRIQFDEWQWSYNGVPFIYADNTTVSMRPEQRTSYLGVSYIHRF